MLINPKTNRSTSVLKSKPKSMAQKPKKVDSLINIIEMEKLKERQKELEIQKKSSDMKAEYELRLAALM